MPSVLVDSCFKSMLILAIQNWATIAIPLGCKRRIVEQVSGVVRDFGSVHNWPRASMVNFLAKINRLRKKYSKKCQSAIRISGRVVGTEKRLSLKRFAGGRSFECALRSPAKTVTRKILIPFSVKRWHLYAITVLVIT